MTSCERIKCTLRHEEPDRVPITDGPWHATITRWKKEGFPEDISAEEYFGYEMVTFNRVDLSPRFPTKIIEKNERYVMAVDSCGGTRRSFRDGSTTPEVIGWPIKSKKDWPKIKERLFPDYTRVDWATGLSNVQRAHEEGKFVAYLAAMGYDHLQSYLKSEELLIAMVTDPAWVKEMFQTVAELMIQMVKMMIEKGFKFDGALLCNDMGYRNASLFSPKTYRETLLEIDKMVCDFFHSYHMPVILHSCGNVKELIPYLIEAGFDCLNPLEVKAGMDVRELKRKYGDKLSFMGGIDARAMANPDPKVIEEEIRSKFKVAKKGGGYIYHSDHSVPKNVSFQQYKRVMELVKECGQY